MVDRATSGKVATSAAQDGALAFTSKWSLPLRTPSSTTIRPVEEHDVDAIVLANNAEIPAVSRLDRDGAQHLIGLADLALVAEVDGAFAGFVLALPPGIANYEATNYRWFENNLEDYLYVERIVVADGSQGQGVGRSFYDHLIEDSDRSHLVSEVNTNPRNEASLAFHDRYDFQPIGELTYGDDITCVKLARPLAPRGDHG